MHYPTIRIPTRILRCFVRKYKNDLIFVYGCGRLQTGDHGQAKEMLRELNAFGVPTKHRGCMDSANFFNDALYDAIVPHIDKAIDAIPIDGRPIIVLPKIGMGKSFMNTKAPRLYEHMRLRLDEIMYPNIEWDYQTDGMNY